MPLFGKKLENKLNELHYVTVEGVKFKIKKLEPIHFLNGSKVMQQYFDTYTVGNKVENPDEIKLLKQVKEHFKDVFLAAVVEPKLKRKNEPEVEGIFVENLFTEWSLCNELYAQIQLITYGKKKSRFSAFLDRLASI